VVDTATSGKNKKRKNCRAKSRDVQARTSAAPSASLPFAPACYSAEPCGLKNSEKVSLLAFSVSRQTSPQPAGGFMACPPVLQKTNLGSKITQIFEL